MVVCLVVQYDRLIEHYHEFISLKGMANEILLTDTIAQFFVLTTTVKKLTTILDICMYDIVAIRRE